jgi:predicted methyltransferase
MKRYTTYRLVDDTIEIDGIRMHQTKLITPLKDAENKVNLIPIKNNYIILDTCMGLGYTAILAAQKAKLVFSIEFDPYVFKTAKNNPLSKKLFTSPNIIKIIGNSFDLVKVFPENYFDGIIHDPPRLKRSGELYSEEFYNELFRILKKNRYIFHYTGTPGSKKGKNIPKGVKKRLSFAGFQNIKWIDYALGFKAKKL